MLHTEFKHFGLHNSPTLSALCAKNDLGETNLMLRLVSLSERSQWILYTAQCQRPNRQSLHEHQIDCARLSISKHQHATLKQRLSQRRLPAEPPVRLWHPMR